MSNPDSENAPPSLLKAPSAPKSLLRPPTATGTTPVASRLKNMTVTASENKRPNPQAAALPVAKKPKTRAPLTTRVEANKTKAGPAPSRPTAARGVKRQVQSKIDSKPPTSKRAAWDTKGRLEDAKNTIGNLREKCTALEDEREDFTRQLSEKEKEVETLSSIQSQLESDLAASKSKIDSSEGAQDALRAMMGSVQAMHKQQTESLKGKLAAHVTELALVKTQLATSEAELNTLRTEIVQNRAELSTGKVELENALSKVAGLKTVCHQRGCRLGVLEGETASLRSIVEKQVTDLNIAHQSYEQSAEDSRMKASKIDMLEADLVRCRQVISEQEKSAQSHEMLRRKLHNTIQELKGNIRVFVRMRPFLSTECDMDEARIIEPEFTDSTELEVTEVRPALVPGKPDSEKKSCFSFDKVFNATTSQETCFEEISQLVQSALDGYNVCIFAYGVTGSGKSYTMEGSLEGENRGMIPRAVEHIFATSTSLKEKGWEYTLSASMLEIYNETLQDLLVKGEKKLEIHTDMEGNTTVPDLTIVPVTTAHEIQSVLHRASAHRATASTLCNADSSRSHSVFQLRVSGNNSGTGQTTSSMLNLIDLAGSERLAQSGSEGDRLKETQAINKSLSSLGDVISAIGSGKKHVPYRNTKLTFLLQNSLKGQSKVLMFANISPLATYTGTLSDIPISHNN